MNRVRAHVQLLEAIENKLGGEPLSKNGEKLVINAATLTAAKAMHVLNFLQQEVRIGGLTASKTALKFAEKIALILPEGFQASTSLDGKDVIAHSIPAGEKEFEQRFRNKIKIPETGTVDASINNLHNTCVFTEYFKPEHLANLATGSTFHMIKKLFPNEMDRFDFHFEQTVNFEKIIRQSWINFISNLPTTRFGPNDEVTVSYKEISEFEKTTGEPLGFWFLVRNSTSFDDQFKKLFKVKKQNHHGKPGNVKFEGTVRDALITELSEVSKLIGGNTVPFKDRNFLEKEVPYFFEAIANRWYSRTNSIGINAKVGKGSVSVQFLPIGKKNDENLLLKTNAIRTAKTLPFDVNFIATVFSNEAQMLHV